MPLPRLTPVEGHEIIIGDVRKGLREVPDEIVQCCVTSPPYYGLRDYGTGQWEGGDANCDHKSGRFERGGLSSKQASNHGSNGDEAASVCPKCGAHRIDSQIGLEETPEQYIQNLVAVFREVKRVLRNDGTCFVNMGDSYHGSWGNSGNRPELDGKTQNQREKSVAYISRGGWDNRRERPPSSYPHEILKPKDLMLMPWHLAIALQADGWYIRDIIVWHKPNPMPSSVQDRCTSSWEPIIMMAKNERYYCDMEAVKQQLDSKPHAPGNKERVGITMETRHNQGIPTDPSADPSRVWASDGNRNLRNVWKFSTQGTPDAHFATFPDELPLRCIKMGTSEKGCCPTCGTPWERVVESVRRPTRPGENTKIEGTNSRMHVSRDVNHPTEYEGKATDRRPDLEIGNRDPQRHVTESTTIGWAPGCRCYGVEELPEYPPKPKDYEYVEIGIPGEGTQRGRRPGAMDDPVKCDPEALAKWEAACVPIREKRLALIETYKPLETVPQIVLDPFLGSGTTAKAARILGRHSVGCELNQEYAEKIAIAKIRDAFEQKRRPKAKKVAGQKSIFDE